jgi:CPA1 family monovalent cation:H+ antiporter
MLGKKLPRLPLTVLLVFIGIAISTLGDQLPGFGSLANFHLTPELVLLVFIPTLIFESAFNLDARQVGRNVWPILALAIPGLLLSTVVIGFLFSLFTSFDLMIALLLGAILSATDPVAVVAIFKQLGVPERLTILLEGESLFNDATSLVLATILIGILTSGLFSSMVVMAGVGEFFLVFLGGILVGWLLAVIAGYTLGAIKSDPAIEITLTTILAYLSFIIAEHLFHVSGIMAVVAAGLTIGSWGKSKISPSTREFMEHFWEYLAYLANVLIFLLVGLQMDLHALWTSADLIAVVIGAMLVSRAVVIFGLIPILDKIQGGEKIGIPFKQVMFWGGLRGAIALAIVLSLPEFEYKDTLVAIVMGAVLFTLVVQGLTIESLVKMLRLDELSHWDLLATREGDRGARVEGLKRLDGLVKGGVFSIRVADNIRTQCEQSLEEIDKQLVDIHNNMESDEELKILAMRCLAREKARYYELFSKGLLNEWAYRELDYTANVQLDSARHQGRMPSAAIEDSISKSLSLRMVAILDVLPGTQWFAEKLRTIRIVRDYDVAWGHYRAANSVLKNLDIMASEKGIKSEVVEKVREVYNEIFAQTKLQISEVAIQYPEFVEVVQEQLGQRLLLIAEHESVEQAADRGLLQQGLAKTLLKDRSERIRRLKKDDISACFEIESTELLKKVPFLKGISEGEFEEIARYLKPRTVPRGTKIIRQGEAGSSMFLIARGVANVIIEDDGEQKQVASLYAGAFFGEAALLHGTPRNATAIAATPCSLYEWHRDDLERICVRLPNILAAVEQVDRERIRFNEKS